MLSSIPSLWLYFPLGPEYIYNFHCKVLVYWFKNLSHLGICFYGLFCVFKLEVTFSCFHVQLLLNGIWTLCITCDRNSGFCYLPLKNEFLFQQAIKFLVDHFGIVVTVLCFITSFQYCRFVPFSWINFSVLSHHLHS